LFVSKQWDKKVHMLENNGFYGKTVGFGENIVVFLFKKAMFLHDFTHDLF